VNLTVEAEREDDGRWIAEVPDFSGVLAYGATRDQAIGCCDTRSSPNV
jgi:predicted RNase H-like HicB family nuclease